MSTSPCGGCISSTDSSLCGDVVELLDAEREAHAPLGAELVDQQRVLGALDVLEQERRPFRLHGAVDDLGDLELGIDLDRDAPQLALALEERDPSRRSEAAPRASVYGRRPLQRSRECRDGDTHCVTSATDAARTIP